VQCGAVIALFCGYKRRAEVGLGYENTHSNLTDAADTLPRMPPWVTSARTETLEDVAFLSGAALATLHLVVGRADVPHALLRDRQSLTASEACMRLLGRPEKAGDLRDAVHLLRPGDQHGPAGAVYQQWRRAVARPISVKALQRALPSVNAEQIATWLDTGRAAAVLETVLAEHPREEAVALILADAVLALSLGWTHILPLLAVGLKSRDLRKRGRDLQLACHKALVSSIGAALPMASDLTRRAAHLRAVIPKLRANARQSHDRRLLMTIPDVGTITATAFATASEDPENFKNSRAVGAWLGLTTRRDRRLWTAHFPKGRSPRARSSL